MRPLLSSHRHLGVGMKIGVPWRVNGIRPDARETARQAARRAGMSVGDWLNTVILESVMDEGVEPSGGACAADEAENDALFAVHERLDELTRQLERRNRSAEAQSRTAPSRFAEANHDSLAQAIARLDRRLDQLVTERTFAASAPPPPSPPPAEPWSGGFGNGMPGAAPQPAEPWSDGLDQAIAEITARQQALDSEAVTPPPSAAPAPRQEPMLPPRPAPMPAQNLSGLEQQLRDITTQIQALRAPSGLEEGIAELRHALGEIARTLTEAMPKRAIEALEAEVRILAERLDNSRHSGVDASTLAAVERGLAEIRDTLHTLTPAENLAGFHEAVLNLAQRIDLLGSSTPDPAAFQQLESAIAALRGIVSHVASNEGLVQLAEEVRSLGAKIDEVASLSSASGNALTILEKRIAHIAEALEARAQNGGSVPPQLDALIKGLSDKIERLHLTQGDAVALGNFEDRLVKLVEKLDASGARFSQLEAIERGLADLLVHMDAQRESNAAGAPANIANVEGLQRDLGRTQTSLEAVHGTLEHVVDRLAMLERGMRGQPAQQPQMPPAAPLPEPAAAASAPPPPLAPPPVEQPSVQPPPVPDRATAAAQAAAAMARANPRPPRLPIDPSLPPDHPLEPGFGVSRGRRSASAADRIAASEAALGPAKPPVIPDPAGKSDFIAAARRAAQAAAADPSSADLRAAANEDASEESSHKTLGQRVRTLLVGASVILLVGASWRIAENFIAPQTVTGGAPQMTDKQAGPPAQDVQTTASTGAAPSTSKAASGADGSQPEDTDGDITGSVLPQTPQAPVPASLPPLPSSPPPSARHALPAAIGGPALRTAAASGNPAAQYEVGVRYAEGHGVAVDSTEAARWLERAAKQGLAPAQFRLAGHYEKGDGVKKDIETARRLYTAAAEQGNAKAMHNLAVLYAEGAVKPDYRTAAQWFRMAAEHGVADSQYNLAILCARGIGVDRNLGEAYKWFAIAAAQGDQEAAGKRDDVGKHLDKKALAKARQAAKSFVPQPQPAAATTVPVPPGGWDAARSSKNVTPLPRRKAPAARPLKLGSR